MNPRSPHFEHARFTRFRVVREIGGGAQGTVLEAIDVERDARVAIKTLRALGADEIARIKSEFRTVRDLRHPNLLRLGELIEEGGRWFFTMELVEGVDLLAYVRAHQSTDLTSSWPTRSMTRVERISRTDEGRATPLAEPVPEDRPPAAFDEAKLRHSLAQLASALEHLHRAGKVHRDLKPSNVLVETGGRTVLIDFGVASELSDDEEGQLVGTVPYMAPEQVLGEIVGPAADWYAVGVILFEALTGRRPFEGSANDVMERKCMLDAPRPSDFVREVPPDLEALCVRMLARVADERATGNDAQRVLGGIDAARDVDRESPFVGRQAELEALARAYEDVVRGGTVAVALEGESGVGKSALARRFVGEMRARVPRPVVLAGRCHEDERVPYNAFDAVIDALARHLRGRKASTRAELLPPSMDRVRTLFPTFGALDGEQASVAPARADGARGLRDEAFAALRELLRRVGARSPIVLLLEDVQWADADSIALLEALTEAPGAPRMLIVATARRPERGGSCAAVDAVRGDVRRVPIGGLGASDAGLLVDRLIAGARGSSSIDPASIVEGSRGHPMFIEEMVRYLSQTTARSGALALDDALRARARALGPEARHVLAVVAVAGAPTDQGVIAAAAGVPFATYAEHAATLHEAKLARVRGSRQDDPVEPFHDRVREAVVADLAARERASIHAALGEALEARLAGPELLFHHFEEAGDLARAVKYAEAAASAAGRALAFDRAVDLYRRALALGPRDAAHRRRLLAALGEKLIDAGRSKEAAQCFLEAATTGEPDRSEHLDLVRRAAERFLMSGHIAEGMAATDEVLEASGLAMPKTWLGAIARFGWYQLRLERRKLVWTRRRPEDVDPAAAMRMDLCWSVGAGLGLVDSMRSMIFVLRGALECLEHGDDARIARALATAAVGEAGLIRREPAARLASACRRAAEAEGSDRSRFYVALVALTEQFFLRNDWPATVAEARKAELFWRSSGRTEGWEVDVVDQFTCWALDNGGQFRALGERVPAKIRAAQRAGNRFVEVNFRTEFVNLRLTRDRAEDARREVNDAIAAWPRTGTGTEFGNQHYLALRGLTSVALYERDEEAAARLLPEWRRYFASLMSRVLFLRMDALWNVGAIALLRASAARTRTGKGGGASAVKARLREAHRAWDEVRGIDLPYARANATQLRIGIATLEGDPPAAIVALRAGLADAVARGAELHVAAMRRRLGELVGGDEGRALCTASDTWMQAEAVRAPGRLIGTVLPGGSET